MVSWSSGLKTLLKPYSHDCTLALILESGWLRTSLSMSGFRDKQRTLVNTVGVPRCLSIKKTKKMQSLLESPLNNVGPKESIRIKATVII
jgi:hypothetical protein